MSSLSPRSSITGSSEIRDLGLSGFVQAEVERVEARIRRIKVMMDSYRRHPAWERSADVRVAHDMWEQNLLSAERRLRQLTGQEG